MRIVSILILSVLFVAELVTARSAAAKSEEVSNCPRVPVIELERAVLLARAKVDEMYPDQLLFPDSATMKCEAGKQVWHIGWRRKEYESGHLIVDVLTDETAKVGKVVKDG